MKLSSPVQIFGRGLTIYKDRFIPLILVRLIASAGLLAISIFGLKGLLVRLAAAFNVAAKDLGQLNPTTINQLVKNLSFEELWAIFTTPALWLAVMAFVLISVWAQAGTLLAITPNDQNKRPITQVIFGALALMPALFVLDTCYVLIAGFGLALFILPGIAFLVKFALAPWVLVVEDESSLGSLSRSSQLVKGFWWAVFWRWLIIALVTFAGSAILKKFGLLGNLAASLTFAPLYSCFMLALLESLKEAKPFQTQN